MNERKMRVVEAAHRLFIEKGIHATSIQEIIDHSGISKGTFYNYFSSKNELLIAIFKMTYAEFSKQQDELLIGQDPSDIEIFTKQIEVQLKTNHKRKLISLFEEVMVSNDADLKEYLQRIRLNNIRWIYQRLMDLFGEEKKAVLLDCAIMFIGMLRENLQFNRMTNKSNFSPIKVVRYSVKRLVDLVEGAADSNEQLLDPDVLEIWFPDCKKPMHGYKKKLHKSLSALRNFLNEQKEPKPNKFVELLDFIEEEFMDSKSPRPFIIESALLSLNTIQDTTWQTELRQLEQLIGAYFKKKEEMTV
ncbi:TetR/AcrR family transcriptional regulator [Bacillus sp. JJ1764]|uniref:TetR/AcrR family transcriptional regulator n=1 Tax=Bacillus sp. JJ1764 TaxID=3122964 RepID=UPI002FFED17C